MKMRLLQAAGLFILTGIFQALGVFLIKSGPSPLNWRELAGIFSIIFSWHCIGLALDAFRAGWRSPKRHR